MNIFRNEKAPFVVVILVGVLGWYVSSLQSNLNERLPLIYSISFSTEQNGVVTLENISKAKSFNGEFQILCTQADDDTPCFNIETSVEPRYRVVPPFNLSNEISPEGNEAGSLVKVDAWIPPTATIQIEFDPNFEISNYHFRYLPTAEEASKNHPQFLEPSLESWLLKHFDTLVVWGFVAALVTFGTILILHLRAHICSLWRGE